MQMLGSMAHIFLERSLVLGDEIAYWEDVRSSSWYTGLYAAQTSPHRIWRKIQAAYLDRERPFSVALVSTGWTEFYNRMQRCFKPQSVYRLRDALPSVLAKSKSEVRQKQKSLEAMKTRYTSCIGFLVQECLTFQIDSGISNSEPYDLTGEQWRNFVLKSAIVIEKIASATGNYTPDFEEETLATIAREADTLESSTQGTYSHLHPDLVIDRLLHILRNSLPNNLTLSKMAINNHRRPSYITRYWIPFAFGFFTANTFMRIWVAQRAKLLSWAMDIGSTTVRFWGNWVVEPIEKLVKTIRHDEGSDIALMSKNSLEADRASLERMVVDFVTDHDPSTGGTTPTNANAVALKVREGDLTPVLRAYERDLRAPFIGTVRGDLIRALLIQIQKTKVDVEVAMSGIDSLLKSQELVFGCALSSPNVRLGN